MEGKELLKFRCTDCGNCCKLRVVVTDMDLARLMAGTGLPPKKIVRFYGPDDIEGKPRGKGWINFSPRLEDRRVMALREQRGGACVFFKNNRCTVYPHRPVTCRVYPFNLEFDNNGRRVSGIEINDACQCDYDLEGKVSLRELKRNDGWDDQQDEVFFAKIRYWNRTRKLGTQREFLEYLKLDELVPLAVDELKRLESNGRSFWPAVRAV